MAIEHFCRTLARGAFRLGLPLLAALLSGCGGQPYSTVPISGTVKYEDGSLIPAPQIVLYFESQEENRDAKTFPRPGKAEVNVRDGTFDTVSTYEHGDGVILGEHKVVVEAFNADGAPVYAYFPKEFSDVTTTPRTITVGEKRQFDITLPKP